MFRKSHAPVASEVIEMADAFVELERAVHRALETYSNVHRGSGHGSLVSTHLYEEARELILEHLGLGKDGFAVVFCTPRRAELLASRLPSGSFRLVSSEQIGLPLGIRALAVRRRSLPEGVPFERGGGTARLVSPGWVVWARPPERFEAGTPAIVNVIAFAKALRLVRARGADAFHGGPRDARPSDPLTAEAILRRDDLDQDSGRELLAKLRQSLIGRGVQVPTTEGASPYVNLDNAASTPTFEPIWNAVRRAWRQPARVRQEIVQEVRAICAEVLGAPAAGYDVVFTSNTTEALNLMAESLRRESEPGSESVVVNTALEHNSNELPWRNLPGVSLLRLPVDSEGFLDLETLERLLCAYNEKGEHGSRRVRLVAVSGASNVLGVFNDLAAIARVVHRYGARLLVDGAQLVAHRKVEMDACGIDALAFSAHKVYAPFGSGALLVRKGLLGFGPVELERIQASGEENVGGIAALGKALVLLQRIGLDVIQEEEQALTRRALRGMAQVPGLTIYGIQDPDSARFACRGGVIAFGLKGMLPDRVARTLAEQGGIGSRYGCHCTHILIKRLLRIPPALEQFQRLIVTLFPRLNLPGVARVSLGIENTAEDVDRLLTVLGTIRQGRRDKVVEGQIDEFARTAAQEVYATAPA
jgi:selenocysteine lyase/cysteine desulfurase